MNHQCLSETCRNPATWCGWCVDQMRAEVFEVFEHVIYSNLKASEALSIINEVKLIGDTKWR